MTGADLNPESSPGFAQRTGDPIPMRRRETSIQSDSSGVTPFNPDKNERRALLELWRSQFIGREQPSRGEPRFDVDAVSAEAQFTHPAGGIARAEVVLVDVSSRGLCVLHGGYLHPSTACTVTLKNTRGEKRVCKGIVAWCQFLRGRYHALGVRLEDTLELREFLDAKLWLEHAQELHAQESSRIAGRALMLTNDHLQIVVVQMTLADTDLKLETFESPGAVADSIHSAGCDLILVDADSAGAEAVPLVTKIRKEGYSAGSIAIAAGQQHNVVQTLRDAGYDEVLLKPLDKDELLTTIHLLFHRANAAADGTGPVYSSLPSGAVRPDWLKRYVESAGGQAKQLEECSKADDLEASTALCESFKATGKSFGYEMLTEAADEALKALRASCSPRESMASIYRLIRVVNRLSPNAKEPGRAA